MSGILDEHAEPAENTLDREDSERLFQGGLGIRSISLTGVFLLACFYTLHFGREFFLPIVIAVLLTFLLAPVVRALKSIHIPEFLGSALVILSAFACVGLGGHELSGPMASWVQRAPELGAKLEKEMRHLQRPVQQVSQASEQVRKLATITPENQRAPQRVELKPGAPLTGLFGWTWNFMAGLMVVTILLYFLLASGDLFLRKLISVLPRFRDKKKAVQIAREVEDSISRYLLTAATINAALGTVAALAFWGLGLPNPFLWGAMGACFNFVPFLGAIATIAIVTCVAVATLPTAHALLVPAVYLGFAVLEGSFITPWFVGRRMTLNPVVIFLALVFWGWIWGIAGALLAVPMVAVLKILCDHIEPLAPIGEFLGQ